MGGGAGGPGVGGGERGGGGVPSNAGSSSSLYSMQSSMPLLDNKMQPNSRYTLKSTFEPPIPLGADQRVVLLLLCVV